MKIARLIMLGVAVAAGASAFLLLEPEPAPAPVPEAEPVREAAPAAPPKPAVAMDEVLVATADLLVSRIIAEGDLVWQAWPVEAIRSSMIRRTNAGDVLAEVRGAYVRMPFSAGDPVRLEKLILPGRASGFLAATLPAGMRAMAIPIDSQGTTSAGGFILPNDRVDILRTSREDAQTSESSAVQTVLANIRVLAIGQNAQERSGERTLTGATATLEVTPEQGEVLMLAQRSGQLSLLLRSFAENNAASGAPAKAQPLEHAISIVRFGVQQGTK